MSDMEALYHRKTGIWVRIEFCDGVRPFVRQSVVRQFAVRCKLLDERKPVISE
jgi:hypothetical protein